MRAVCQCVVVQPGPVLSRTWPVLFCRRLCTVTQGLVGPLQRVCCAAPSILCVRCCTARWVWCGVVWCGVVWCDVVWCGVVWRGVAWCGVVWCGVVWCGVKWCGVVWCGVSEGWHECAVHCKCNCQMKAALHPAPACLLTSIASSKLAAIKHPNCAKPGVSWPCDHHIPCYPQRAILHKCHTLMGGGSQGRACTDQLPTN